jgi:hypothetical protein
MGATTGVIVVVGTVVVGAARGVTMVAVLGLTVIPGAAVEGFCLGGRIFYSKTSEHE